MSASGARCSSSPSRARRLAFCAALVVANVGAWDSALSDAKDASNEELVHFLNEKTFWPTVNAAPCSLVEFYAPWCPHCMHFRPAWAQTAKLLADAHSPCQVGSIDSTSNRTLASKFHVRSFPSLFFFRRGSKAAVTYTGGRAPKELAAWLTMKSKSGPPIVALRSAADVDKLLRPPAAGGGARPALVLLRVSQLSEAAGGAGAPITLAAGAIPAEAEALAAMGTLSEEMEGKPVRFGVADRADVVARAAQGGGSGAAATAELPSGMAIFVAGSAEAAADDKALGHGTSVPVSVASYADKSSARVARYPFKAREALTFPLDGGDPAAHEMESPWGGAFKYFVGANLMPLVTMYDEGSSGQLLGHTVQVHCLLFVDSRKMSGAGLEAAKAAFAVAAAKARGRMLHMILDSADKYGDGVRSFFGLPKADEDGAARLPAFFIADMRDEMIKYKLPHAQLTPTDKLASSIEAFEAKFLAGELKPMGEAEEGAVEEAKDDDHTAATTQSPTAAADLKINLVGVNLRGAKVAGNKGEAVPTDTHREIRE